MQKAKNINLSTVKANDHPLSITGEDGLTVAFTLTAPQICMLCYQAIAAQWSYYKLVPRE